MTVLLGLATGFLAARLLWAASADLFAAVVLARPNHRGRFVPTGVGILLALVLFVVEGGRAAAAAAGVGAEGLSLARVLMLAAVAGFAALGFLDDVLGGDAERGWRAHVGALRTGRLSAGGVKLLGGGALGLALAGAAGSGQSLWRLAVDGVIVALAANLGNAFDRAPGRTIKVATLAWLPLAAIAGSGAAGVALAPVMGAALGMLPDDLGERLMLGDAGANALGAALGVGAVLAVGPGARLVIAAVLVVLNAAAELFSFSKAINANPALRTLDRLGRVK